MINAGSRLMALAKSPTGISVRLGIPTWFMTRRGGASLGRWTIAIGKPASIKLRTPDRALLAALRGLRPRATLSRDAGRYLCNYLCWRASEKASTSTRPRFTAFIHVPPVRRGPRRKRDKALASLNDLTVAGTRALVALIAAARR